MTLRPYHRGCVLVSTGMWPFRRWMVVDTTGYAVAGNINFTHGTGAQMLRAGRTYLTQKGT